jgi:hypothetical protein
MLAAECWPDRCAGTLQQPLARAAVGFAVPYPVVSCAVVPSGREADFETPDLWW